MRGASVSTKTTIKDVPVKPYEDNTVWQQFTMYDRMPYIWDTDLNAERLFRKETGNIIKAYRCKIEEPFEVKHE